MLISGDVYRKALALPDLTDAAYGPMVERIVSSTAPSFLFLHYFADRWLVRDLFFIPRFFLSHSVIERRRALAASARARCLPSR